MKLSCRIHGVCAVGSALAILVVPSPAGARDVEYRAPAECPRSADVTARIETRAPHGGPARLAIEKTKSGFHGDVVVGEGDGRLARSVDARSCSAVVEALELVLALNSDAAGASGAGGDIREGAGDTNDRASTVDAHPRADVVARDAPISADVASATDARARRHILTIGSTVSYSSFSAGHGALVGGALYGDVALPTRTFGLSFLQPSFRASLGGTFPHTTSSARYVAGEPRSNEGFSVCVGCGPVITTVKTAVDACPVGVNLDGAFSVAACARGEVGALFADLGGSNANVQVRPWMAAGPVVRSRVMWGSGGIRPAFEVTAGLLAPLRRDRFHYDNWPTDVAAPWLWTFGFGGGVVFH